MCAWKVVLKKNVQSIGTASEVVTVKDGFFMNYLQPRGLAEKATSEALADVQNRRVATEAANIESISAAGAIKDKIERADAVSIAKKAGEEGAIFGSVSVGEVVAALGLEGSPKVAFDAITKLGEYEVTVMLHPKVTATAKVKITRAAE